MKWYHWVGIAVVFTVLLLVWIATAGKGPNPLTIAQREIDVVNAKAEVKKVRNELDTAQALKHVEDKYHDELAAMDEAQTKQAEELKKDPAKLAAFIVRGNKS